MIKKKLVILEELLIWLRGRFSLTGEEKVWLLLVLFICWTGLLARTIHLKNQKPEIVLIEELVGDAP